MANVSKDQIAVENALIAFTKTNGKNLATEDARRITKYLALRERQLLQFAVLKTNGKITAYEKLYFGNIERCTLQYIKQRVGCPCEIQDDPRGMQIRLYLKTDATNLFFNNFDGETTGVNWLHDDEDES